MCVCTDAGGGLSSEVDGVEADGALGGAHVESLGEAVGGVVVQPVLPTPAVLCTQATTAASAEPRQLL